MFHQNRGYPFIADILVGGYDNQGPQLFNIDMFGSVEEKNYVTTGSGSPVAYGLLEDEYREDLSLDEAKIVALRAVKAAITRNIGTGDGINIAVIDKDGFRLCQPGFQKVPDGRTQLRSTRAGGQGRLAGGQVRAEL